MNLPLEAPKPPTDSGHIRVLLVDDSAVIRGIFRRVLDAEPTVKVLAAVGNGQAAVDAVRTQEFDVVVLDIEMPGMDGLTALPLMLQASPGLKVVMASTLTRENADISMKALALGAADYIPKPTSKVEIHSAQNFQRELLEKVKALGQRRRSEARRGPARPAPSAPPAGIAKPPAGAGGLTLRAPSKVPPKLLAIGSSTGGPQALVKLVGGLRDNFDLPIVITQHMPKTFTGILAEHLAKASGRPSAEAVNGEPVVGNRIYVAPGDWHMELVAQAGGAVAIRLNQNPPENFCRPSVDPMFRSIAQVYGPRALAVVLTGMGQDGLAGGRVLVDAGSTLIAQDEASSVVWGMPGAVAQAGICSAVLPIGDLASEVRKLSGRTVR